MSATAVVELDECDLPLSLSQIPPGPELGFHLSLVEWSALSDRELVAVMDAARRQATWAQTMMLDAVGELARRRHEQDPTGGSDAHRRICGEVSLELTVPTGRAEELVAMAETLPTRLPRTWAAMRTGQIDYDRALVMVDGVMGLDPQLARHLDAELIPDAVESTKPLLRRRLTRAIKTADPAAYAERTKTARAERRVEVWDNDDETCDLIGRNLNAVDAHAIGNRLTAAAHAMKTDGDQRPIDHIRLDLFRDLLRGIPLPEATRHLNASHIPGHTPGHSDDTAADTTADDAHQPARRLAAQPTAHHRLADEAVADAERRIACVLAGIADEELRRVLDRVRAHGRLDDLPRVIGQATWAMREALNPIVESWCTATGPTSTTQTTTSQAGHGHHGYRPPAAMQRLIQRRHPMCVFPTCNRRAIHCDIDHTVPYDKGGRTCRCNLAPLCRTHHRIIKQHPQWELIHIWPGLLIWVTPAGTWHIVVPQ